MSMLHQYFHGVYGRAVDVSSCSPPTHYIGVSPLNFLSLNCASRSLSSVCTASSHSYRRNPESLKENKQRFYRSRNRQFEERDNSDKLEDSEIFSSKNGILHSVSSRPKYQATATQGPRGGDIVELFRKVQTQLRERAALKEEKMVGEPPVQGKKNETVDSLLELLKKHSVHQGKSAGSSKDIILDEPEVNEPSSTEKSSSLCRSNNIENNQVLESQPSSVMRPMSSFRRKSPVPRVEKQTIYLEEDTVSSISHTNLEGKEKDSSYLLDEVDHTPKLNLKVDPIVHSSSQEESKFGFPAGDMFDEISDSETNGTDEGYTNEDTDEQNMNKHIDLSGMKLLELRALSKSRGIKGFSKLKKHELIMLLA